MTIENSFEFVNARELRRRFVGALDTGRRKLTGTEYSEWAPSIERKIQEIDDACEEFFKRLATGIFPAGQTITQLYFRFVSSATTLTPVQPTITTSIFAPPNLLTGALPEVVAPPLFR